MDNIVNPLGAGSEGDGGQQSRVAPPRKRSFSYYEHAPYDKLKQDVLNTNQESQPSADPNQPEPVEGAPKRPPLKKAEPGIRPNENLKATLMVKKDQNKADLSISSLGMRNPIRMKMDWDPIRHFENILIRQIEEMEKQEFAEEVQRTAMANDDEATQ